MDLEHILVILTNLMLAVRGTEQAEDDPDGAMAEDGLTEGVNLKDLGAENTCHGLAAYGVHTKSKHACVRNISDTK
jgi:hypothetical protein